MTKYLKVDYRRKKLRIPQREFFSKPVWNGKNLEESFDLMETTNLFKPLKWDNYYRKHFCSSKWAKLSIWCFEAILRKSAKDLYLSTKNYEFHTEKFLLNEFEKGQIWMNGFDLMEMTFCLNQWNGTIITENIFAHKNVPPTAKRSISGVLKQFAEIDKNLYWRTKNLLSQKEGKNSTERFFSQSV